MIATTFWALGSSDEDALSNALDGGRFPSRQEAADAAQVVRDVAGAESKIFVVTITAQEDPSS